MANSEEEIKKLKADVMECRHLEAEVGYLRSIEDAAQQLVYLLCERDGNDRPVLSEATGGPVLSATKLREVEADEVFKQLERVADLLPVLDRVRVRAGKI